MKPNVVFLHGLNRPILEWVTAHVPGDFQVTAVPGTLPEPQIVDAVREADFLMVYRATLADAALRAATRVRLIQLLAAGYDEFNVELMESLNIPCAQNAGANSWAVADHAVLLMLAVYRRLVACDAATRQGRWREPITGLNTYEMDGKLVGIVGIGNVGRKVAQRVQGFGARVQYFDKFPLTPEREREAGVVRVPLDELFRTSDIVTLHTPLTPETTGLVDAEVLATMKSTAVLINTSRGEIVDESALAAALAHGRLGGAGLDVFEREPVDPASPLLTLDNVVLTPHSAGTTVDTWQRRLDFAFGNMRRVGAGEAPLALVTRTAHHGV
jgi:phosphoglycerate dehydrogenase-like enzyme